MSGATWHWHKKSSPHSFPCSHNDPTPLSNESHTPPQPLCHHYTPEIHCCLSHRLQLQPCFPPPTLRSHHRLPYLPAPPLPIPPENDDLLHLYAQPPLPLVNYLAITTTKPPQTQITTISNAKNHHPQSSINHHALIKYPRTQTLTSKP